MESAVEWWRTRLSATLRRVTLGHSSMLLTYPVVVHYALLSLAAWRCPLFVYTQSATGRFRLPPRRSGTVWGTTSYLLHSSLPSAAYWKLFCSVYRFLIWSCNRFSLVCNFWHSIRPRSGHSCLGHYKNYYYITLHCYSRSLHFT